MAILLKHIDGATTLTDGFDFQYGIWFPDRGSIVTIAEDAPVLSYGHATDRQTDRRIAASLDVPTVGGGTIMSQVTLAISGLYSTVYFTAGRKGRSADVDDMSADASDSRMEFDAVHPSLLLHTGRESSALCGRARFYDDVPTPSRIKASCMVTLINCVPPSRRLRRASEGEREGGGRV